jgi:hypothetical protein
MFVLFQNIAKHYYRNTHSCEPKRKEITSLSVNATATSLFTLIDSSLHILQWNF